MIHAAEPPEINNFKIDNLIIEEKRIVGSFTVSINSISQNEYP